MVSMSALHALTAELHVGFLTLAVICITIVAISKVVLRYRHRVPRRLCSLASDVQPYAESAGYVGAIAGVVALILSAVTGMYAWPSEALFDSVVVKNKILLTSVGTVIWCMVVYTRARYGRGLWSRPPLALTYTLIAFVAYAVIGMAGSLGAHLTMGESILDPFWELFGVGTDDAMVLSTFSAVVVTVASIGVITVALVFSLTSGLPKGRHVPETHAGTADSEESAPEQTKE